MNCVLPLAFPIFDQLMNLVYDNSHLVQICLESHKKTGIDDQGPLILSAQGDVKRVNFQKKLFRAITFDWSVLWT